MARRNPYRPGTASYARKRATLLKRRAALAGATAARAKDPDARRRAQRRATSVRRELRAIETREAFRDRLKLDDRLQFDKLTLGQQTQLLRVAEHYPERVPPDAPDPFASEGFRGSLTRSSQWRLFYATRAGARLRAVA
jgi:hypothetical protein